ncbi:glucan endo-1,3-beta-glucosidase 4-like protein, partial [Tanacetum coccineum]
MPKHIPEYRAGMLTWTQAESDVAVTKRRHGNHAAMQASYLAAWPEYLKASRVSRYIETQLIKCLIPSHPLNFNTCFSIQSRDIQPLPEVKRKVDPDTLFHYESMFDVMVDSIYYFIAADNFSVIPSINVTETGWPCSRGANESYANMAKAKTLNNNLIKRVLTGSGPPSQP